MIRSGSSHTCSRGEEQPDIKSDDIGFSIKQEVDYFVPVSNDYLQVYGERVDEMEESAKS